MVTLRSLLLLLLRLLLRLWLRLWLARFVLGCVVHDLERFFFCGGSQ